MAVHMGERFKYTGVQIEISLLVRADPKAVIDEPQALNFLLGDKLEPGAHNALRVCPVLRMGFGSSISSVALCLGCGPTGHRRRLFPTAIRQSPTHTTIRYASSRGISRRVDILLCSPNRPSSACRWSG